MTTSNNNITVAIHALSDQESELRALLARAEMGDLDRLVSILDRFPRPARLADKLSLARTSDDSLARKNLEDAIARVLVRDATSEIAHVAKRRPDLHEAITRSGKRLRLRPLPTAGTLSGRLASLTSAFVDRTLAKMPPEEQQRLVADGVKRTSGHLPSGTRVAQAAAIPALHAAIGTAALVKVAEAIVAQMTAAILGREIARAAMRAIVMRAPIITTMLGPAAWAISGAMLVWEIQRPADRKVIPALLCLGLVAMRLRNQESKQ